MHRSTLRLLAATLFWTGAASISQAASFEWTPYSTISNDWFWTLQTSNNPVTYVNNWGRTGNPAAFPSATDDVHIGPVSGKPAPAISSGYADIKTLTIAAGTSLTLSGSLTIEGNNLTTASPITATSSCIEIKGANAQLNNSSQITLSSSNIAFSGAAPVLTGGGSISLANSAFTSTSANQLTNQNLTISGYGSFSNLSLINRGTIQALTSYYTLALPCSQITNEGTLSATNLATLDISGCQLQNSGSIAATNHGQLQIGTSTVTGNTITGDATSQVAITDTTLRDLTLNASDAEISGDSGLNNVTVNGSTRISDGSTTTLQTALKVDGTLTLDSAVLSLSGTVPLSGAGEVFLNGGTVLGTGKLINTVNSFHGLGEFYGSTLSVENRGTMIAEDDCSLAAVGSPVTNKGTMKAAGGLIVFSNSAVDNTGGTIQALHDSTITVEGGTITGGRLTTSGSGMGGIYDHATLSNLALDGDFRVYADGTSDAGGQLVLSGQINNTGTLSLLGMTTAFADVRLSGTVTLTGSGTVKMSDVPYNYIQGTSSGSTLINNGNTICGSGYIGPRYSPNYTVQLQNLSGTILADVPTRELTLDTDTTLNRGVFRATSGSILRLKDMTLDNAGGLIDAQNQLTRVILDHTTITGGTLQSSSAAIITATESDLSDLTNQAVLTLNPGSTNTLHGTICNNAQIQAPGNSSLISRYYIRDNLTLTGAGMLYVGPVGSRNIFYGQNHRLTNSQDHTICGALYTSTRDLTITNAGLLEANTAAPSCASDGAMFLSLAKQSTDGTAGLLIQPTGTLRACDDGLAYIDNAIINNAGTIEADNGVVQISSTASCTNYSNGTLTGGTWRIANGGAFSFDSAAIGNITTNSATVILDGASLFPQFDYVAGNQGSFTLCNSRSFTTRSGLTNSGALDVGPGCRLGIAGNLTQTAAGCITLGACGIAFNQTSLVQVRDAASLAGRLHVRFAPGYYPPAGTEFTVLTCGSRTGAFSTVTGAASCSVIYDSTSVKIHVITPALRGDINEDRCVNVGDLQRLILAWASQAGPPASTNWDARSDLNNDGYVNVSDLQILVSHWGQTIQ